VQQHVAHTDGTPAVACDGGAAVLLQSQRCDEALPTGKAMVPR
jgi:hypothetical protein